MSNFIPMISSSPPPLDDTASFSEGWGHHANDEHHDNDSDFGGFTSAPTKSAESTNFNSESECHTDMNEVNKNKDTNAHDHVNANDFDGFAEFKSSGDDNDQGWANFSSAHSDVSPNTDSQSGFADLSSPASSGPSALSPKLNHDEEEDDEFADFEHGPTKQEILDTNADAPKRPNSVHFQNSEKTDAPTGTEMPSSERFPGFNKSTIDNTSQDSIIDSGLSSDISPLPKSEDYPDFSEDNKSNDFDCDFTENKSVNTCQNSDNNPTSTNSTNSNNCDNLEDSFQDRGEPSQGLDDSQDTLVDSKSSEQPIDNDENLDRESNCQNELKSDCPSNRTVLASGGENVAAQEPLGSPEGLDSGEEQGSKEDFQVCETNSDQDFSGADDNRNHEEISNQSSTPPQDCSADNGDAHVSVLCPSEQKDSCVLSERDTACDEKSDRSSPIRDVTGTADSNHEKEAEGPSGECSDKDDKNASNGDSHDHCDKDGAVFSANGLVDNSEVTSSKSEESSDVRSGSLENVVVEDGEKVTHDISVDGDEAITEVLEDVTNEVIESEGDSAEQKDNSEANTCSKEEENINLGDLSFRPPGTPDEALEDLNAGDGDDDEWAGFSSAGQTGKAETGADDWAAFGAADTPVEDGDGWAAFSASEPEPSPSQNKEDEALSTPATSAVTEPPPLPPTPDHDGKDDGPPPLPEDDEDDDWGDFSVPVPAAAESPTQDNADDDWGGFTAPVPATKDTSPTQGDDDDDWGGFSAPEPTTKDASQTQGDDEFGDFSEPPPPVNIPSPSSELPPAKGWSQVAQPQAAKVDSAISKCFPNLQINAALVTIATLTDVLVKELERPSKPKTTDRQKKQKSTPTVINVNIWQHLEDLENTNALTCGWSNSSNNQRLLKALAIDPRNILVTKKAAVPIFASSLGLLEPSRGGVLEPTKPKDVTEPTLVDTSKETPVQQPVAGEAIPPVEFDWGSSGLTNPLDCVKHVESTETSSEKSEDPSEPIRHVEPELPPKTSYIEPETISANLEPESLPAYLEPEPISTNIEPSQTAPRNLEPETAPTKSVEPEQPETTTNSSSLLDLDFFTKNQKNNISVPSKSSAFESEFLSSIEPPKQIDSKPLNSLESLLSGMKFTTTMAKPKNAKDENMTSAASKVLGSLPDLSFMQAKVLMFPMKASISE